MGDMRGCEQTALLPVEDIKISTWQIIKKRNQPIMNLIQSKTFRFMLHWNVNAQSHLRFISSFWWQLCQIYIYIYKIKIYKQVKSWNTTQQKRHLICCFISYFFVLRLKYGKQKAFLAEALSTQLLPTDTDTYVFHNSVL